MGVSVRMGVSVIQRVWIRRYPSYLYSAMQCSTEKEEVVIEDIEERLEIEELDWTLKKICKGYLPAINGPHLDSIELGSAVFVRQSNMMLSSNEIRAKRLEESKDIKEVPWG